MRTEKSIVAYSLKVVKAIKNNNLFDAYESLKINHNFLNFDRRPSRQSIPHH